MEESLGHYADGILDAAALPVPRESALLCWPAKFVGTPPNVESAHCTLAYWKSLGGLEKNDILFRLRDDSHWINRYRQWRIVSVTGIDAYQGSQGDLPVLKVEDNLNYEAIPNIHKNVASLFTRNPFSNHWVYSPHVTVDLKTLVNPPKKIILAPMQLWYKDDEPVLV